MVGWLVIRKFDWFVIRWIQNKFDEMSAWLIEKMLDCAGWFVDWLIDWLMDWLILWLIEYLIEFWLNG